MTEQEYNAKLQEACLEFYEEHGECTSCLYGVDEPCECEQLKAKYKEFQRLLNKTGATK